MNESTPAESGPRDGHRGRERGAALAAVALPIVVLLGPALFSDRLFALRDAGHYYYPLFQWCADTWAAGRVPLWNPLENDGTAIHADPTASLWYPGKLVFALPLAFSLNYKLYIVGHVALCAVAGYWLARRWGGSRYAAALAALSYACGGSVVFQHANVVYLVGAAWLPIAAGLVDDVFRRRRIKSAVCLGVVLALVVLGGDPQMAYHVLLVAAIHALVLLAFQDRTHGQEGQTRRATLMGGGLVAASAAMAFCLAAVQILPTSAAVSDSERAADHGPRSLYEAGEYLRGQWRASRLSRESLSRVREGLLGQPPAGTHHAAAYDFSVAPWRLAEFVWPNLGGRMYPTHRRWFSLLSEESRIWTPALYMGLMPLALAVSVFGLRGRDARFRWLSWTALVFVLGSLGTFGAGWMVRQTLVITMGTDSPIGDGVGGVYWLFVVFLPKYALFRYPAKLLVVAALAISQLAAVGWDRAVTEPPRRLIRSLRLLGFGSGVVALGALAAAQFVELGTGNVDPVFGPFDNRGCWNDVVAALAQTSIVALAAAWLLPLASAGSEMASAGSNMASDKGQPQEAKRRASRMAPAALLFLCAAELAVANRWLVPTAPAKLWREPSPVAAAIGNAARPPRLCRLPLPWPDDFSRTSSPDRLAELVRWERATLAGRYGLADGIAVANAQVGLMSKDRARLLELLERSADQGTTRDVLERLGAEYVLAPETGPLDRAETIAIEGLPNEVRLQRLVASAPRQAKPARTPDYSSFRRGAWISGTSWIVLLAGCAVWLCRRRSATKMNGTS